MNWQVISGNPFFTVALPLILTFVFSTWFTNRSQNKRIDDLRDDMRNLRQDVRRDIDELRQEMRRGFDRIDARLDRIEAKLDNHAERIAKLEGPALVRG